MNKSDQVYKFDGYFDEASTTHQVLVETDIVNYPEKLINGSNCTIIGYGQSDAGKHFTIFGENNFDLEGNRSSNPNDLKDTRGLIT